MEVILQCVSAPVLSGVTPPLTPFFALSGIICTEIRTNNRPALTLIRGFEKMISTYEQSIRIMWKTFSMGADQLNLEAEAPIGDSVRKMLHE